MFDNSADCHQLPVIKILLSMLAPRRPERGDGSSPVKTQADEVSTSFSVEDRRALPSQPPDTR